MDAMQSSPQVASDHDPNTHPPPTPTWLPASTSYPPQISIPPPPLQPPRPENASPPQSAENRPDIANKNAVSKMRKPRKANNAGRSTLFWVHTDPQSASEGTREETLKRIRSHVMSEHNRKKRLESTKRYKSKAWKHLAFQPVETTASSSSSNSAAVPTPSPTGGPATQLSVHTTSPVSRGSSESESPSRSSSSPEHIKVEDSVSVSEDEPQASRAPSDASASVALVPAGSVDGYNIDDSSYTQELSPVRSATPWGYASPSGHDPFNTMHTQMSDRMLRHLQHFFDLTRMAYPLQRRYEPKLKAHWASLTQHDPASLHACICVAASNSALATGELPLTDPTRQRSSPLLLDTFHHRGETIRLVNEGLSDPVKASSDELIAAVSILLTIEIASGNPDYLRIHLAGLRQMVAMRHSFADVPPDVRFQISWTDIRVACMALTKPIFPFVRYPRPPHLTLHPPSKDLINTASRLITLISVPGIFSTPMAQTIYDLGELIWWSEWIRGDTNYQSFDSATEDYFNTEVLYVEYALHTDRYTPSGEPKGDASIEGCVRLACLLFHNSAIWSFYPQIAPVFPKPIFALRDALAVTIPAGVFHFCRDLLVWLLFVGACACASRHMLGERTFFVAELAKAVRAQGVRSWQEMRLVLLEFYFVDRVYQQPLVELWEEMATMRLTA